MPKQVQDALLAHQQRQFQERHSAGQNWVESGLVFTTNVGTAIDPRNFRRSFTRLTERAGIGRWHPNELRHSAVSLLSAAGVREEDVADIVGHVTTRMTHRVYRHQVAPAITAGKETMERLFAPSGGNGSIDAGRR